MADQISFRKQGEETHYLLLAETIPRVGEIVKIDDWGGDWIVVRVEYTASIKNNKFDRVHDPVVVLAPVKKWAQQD